MSPAKLRRAIANAAFMVDWWSGRVLSDLRDDAKAAAARNKLTRLRRALAELAALS